MLFPRTTVVSCRYHCLLSLPLLSEARQQQREELLSFMLVLLRFLGRHTDDLLITSSLLQLKGGILSS